VTSSAEFALLGLTGMMIYGALRRQRRLKKEEAKVAKRVFQRLQRLGRTGTELERTVTMNNADLRSLLSMTSAHRGPTRRPRPT